MDDNLPIVVPPIVVGLGMDLMMTIFDSDSEASSDGNLLIDTLMSDGEFSDDNIELVLQAFGENCLRASCAPRAMLQHDQALSCINHDYLIMPLSIPIFNGKEFE